jgi:hypothetical protein
MIPAVWLALRHCTAEMKESLPFGIKKIFLHYFPSKAIKMLHYSTLVQIAHGDVFNVGMKRRFATGD